MVTLGADGKPLKTIGPTHLVPFPRESQEKFAGRNHVAWHTTDLMDACERFAGYLATKTPERGGLEHELLKTMADDLDGMGNNQDVFWSAFTVQAKARGTMFLLVDMDPLEVGTMADQIARRMVPSCTMISPEDVDDFQVGPDGKIDWIEFDRSMRLDGKYTRVTWRFDRSGWSARKGEDILVSGEHPCGECPVLIFTESGRFPCYGQFSQLADLSHRLFNARSELDEILRSQTYSILAYPRPDNQAVDIDQIVATVGTSNMLEYYGSNAPEYVAPPNGPADTYFRLIEYLEAKIKTVSLNVESPDQLESGLALQMRFQALNAALSKWAGRMEDLELRMWTLAVRWLGMTDAMIPEIRWHRNYMLADVGAEISILQQMQAGGMPRKATAAQMKRITSIQFGGLDQNRLDEITAEIDEIEAE